MARPEVLTTPRPAALRAGCGAWVLCIRAALCAGMHVGFVQNFSKGLLTLVLCLLPRSNLPPMSNVIASKYSVACSFRPAPAVHCFSQATCFPSTAHLLALVNYLL